MVSASASSARARWLSILAQSAADQVESRVRVLDDLPIYQRVRGPEIGLVTVQGRAGGTGQRFVLGEVPMTRCVICISDPGYPKTTGFGYIQGRQKRQAEWAAVCDGLLQLPEWQERVITQVIEPLSELIEARRRQQWQTTAATQVEFFNLVPER